MTGDWEAVTGGEFAVGAPVEFTADGQKVTGVIDALWIPSHPLPLEGGGVQIMCRVRTDDERYPFWVGPHTQLRRL